MTEEELKTKFIIFLTKVLREEELKTKFIILLIKVLREEKTYKDILDELTFEEKEAIDNGEVLEKIAKELSEANLDKVKNDEDFDLEEFMKSILDIHDLKDYIIQNLKHNDN